MSHSQDAYFLGMLDIFGCERAYRGPIAGVSFLSRQVLHTGLADNGLDVLCVNYTNERMHQTFLARPTTSHVFHFCKNVHS